MTVEEIKEGLVQVMGKVKGNLQEFQDIMYDLDKDGNGVLDYSEFLAASCNKHALINEQNLKMAFDMLDVDKNGQITKQELRQVFETRSLKEEILWELVMREVDKNGNGSIDYEEFKEVMEKLLSEKYHGLSSMLGVVKMKFQKQFGRKLGIGLNVGNQQQ